MLPVRTRWSPATARLETVCGDTVWVQGRLQHLEQRESEKIEGSIAVGKPVPDFTITLLDGSTLSFRDLKECHTLVEFWATWCGPCPGEMPRLHVAHERFADRGYEIVSLSLGTDPARVAHWRSGRSTMPRPKAILDGDFNSATAQAFQVTDIPVAVLIDPTGCIVAVKPETRGEHHLATLHKLLGPGPSPSPRDPS